MCEQLMPIIICFSHWKTYTTCSCWCFDWLREQGKLRDAVSLEPSLPPLKITIDLEDEDMQWTVIYIAFASNERAFAQSRQSFFYSHEKHEYIFCCLFVIVVLGEGVFVLWWGGRLDKYIIKNKQNQCKFWYHRRLLLLFQPPSPALRLLLLKKFGS